MRRIERDHGRLASALDRAVAWATDPGAFEARAEAVSGWSVGLHLEHLLLSDRAIVGWLERAAAGDASREPGGPSWRGRLVLWTGFIPRGAGRAPDFTVPEGLSRERVEEGFRRLRVRVDGLGARLPTLAAARATMRHPALGTFTSAQWLRFAGVHHAHHEKIIRDVLRASGRA